MKKIVLATLAVAALAAPAFAADTATTTTTTTTTPAAAPAVAAKKVELKDGSLAMIEGDMVKVSKDGGKTWAAAPDGVWETKDGAKLTTKAGKKV